MECTYDWVELDIDFYGTRHCGLITQPWSMISKTNIMKMRFISDYSVRRSGFLAIWSATEEPSTYPTSTGCDTCVFPFPFGEAIFDTCISIEGEDNRPWCPFKFPKLLEEGTHVTPTTKIFCCGSDNSCPSKPAQKLFTSKDYPKFYPDNADQVKGIKTS